MFTAAGLRCLGPLTVDPWYASGGKGVNNAGNTLRRKLMLCLVECRALWGGLLVLTLDNKLEGPVLI